MSHSSANAPDLAALLEERRFKPGIAPPEIRPIYTLRGRVIATPGNLVAITSAIKTGKSAVVGAMAASVMAEGRNIESLGFESSNAEGRALLHFDTEQSADDHWHQAARALRRAERGQPPEWFCSYCLTGLQMKVARDCIAAGLRLASERHGGVHSVLI